MKASVSLARAVSKVRVDQYRMGIGKASNEYWTSIMKLPLLSSNGGALEPAHHTLLGALNIAGST